MLYGSLKRPPKSCCEGIPNTVKAQRLKILFVGRGELGHPMMPKGEGKPEINDPAKGEMLPCSLFPNLIHHRARLNQRP